MREEPTNPIPVFVVGLARSGTKLFRNLLTNHSQIYIPPAETNFFPYFIGRIPLGNGGLTNRQKELFKAWYFKSVFVDRMEEFGRVIDEKKLDACLSENSWNAIFSSLIRAFAGADGKKNISYWGDKTPIYLRYMPLLKKEFPTARFIHIMRDPRDRALSANKAWGADPILAAARWNEQVRQASSQANALSSDYMEVTYEKLLDAPEETMQGVARFLDVPFEDGMLELKAPVENQGDSESKTRRSAEIVRDNKHKFLAGADMSLIRKMEEVALPSMKEKRYEPVTGNLDHRPLGRAERMLRSVKDDAFSFIYHIQRWGSVKGIKLSWERYKLKKI